MINLLLETHPRVGLAAFEARWEADKTGEYADRQFSTILRHDFSRGKCRICGAYEQRHVITDRLLVGCNRGTIRTTYLLNRSCVHGDALSNYRVPW